YIVTNGQVTRGAASITYNTTENLNLAGGSNGNTINIRSTGAVTAVNAGTGDDMINVGSNAPTMGTSDLNGILGALTINGQTGTDTANISDAGDTTNNTGTLTSTQLTSLGTAGITYDNTLENLNISLGSGSDTFNIQSTNGSVSTVLNTGNGGDTVNIGNLSNSLDDIAGVLTVNGQTQTTNDTLNINDQGDGTGNTYTLTASTLNRTGTAAITYSGIETFTLNSGLAGNIINMSGGPTVTDLNINGGTGGDTVNVTNDLEVNGTLTIDSANTVNVSTNRDVTANEINILDFTTVNLGGGVNILAGNGGIRINSSETDPTLQPNTDKINLIGNSGIAVNITSEGDFDIDLADIQAINNPNLFITSDGSVFLDIVNVNEGEIYIQVDNNDNGLETLFAEAIQAKVKTLAGKSASSPVDEIIAFSIISADPITFGGDVVLEGDTSYATTSGQSITFGGKLYTDGSPWTLDVNTTGQTKFSGDIGDEGANTILGYLRTDAGGTTLIDCNVIKANEISLGDAITFNNALAMTTNGAGADTITFGNTVNGTGSGLLDLTANEIRLNGGMTTGGGGINFNGLLTLTNDVSMNTGVGAGDITFANNIQGNHNLTLNTGAGDTFFNSTVGTGTALAGLDVTSNAINFIGSVTVDGDVSLTASGVDVSIGAGGTPVNTAIGGTLTANASNGSGGVYISNTGNLAVASIDADTGDVDLVVTGAITDGSPGDDTNANIIGATIGLEGYSIAEAGIEDLDVTVSTLLNADTTSGPGDIFIESTGDMPVGDITAGTANDVSLASGGDIIKAGAMITSDNLTLNAAGGIGKADAEIETTTTDTMTLTTGGAGNAGDIHIVETNALNTNRITLGRAVDATTQLVSLTSKTGDIIIGGDIGNELDDITLIAETGNILNEYDAINRSNITSDPNYLDWDNIDHGVITANNLKLIAQGDGARIGKRWQHRMSGDLEIYQRNTSVPVMINVAGTLTADASNGNGGIYLEVPKHELTTAEKALKSTDPDLYNIANAPNSITYDYIDAGEGGDIEISLHGGLDGFVEPLDYDDEPGGTNLPNYAKNDYEKLHNGEDTLDNLIRGKNLVIDTGTIGLVNPPQTDVEIVLFFLSDTGEHPAPNVLGGGWSAVVSIEDPFPLTSQAGGGGRLQNYPPVGSTHLPNRAGSVQIGQNKIDPDSDVVIPLGALASSALVVVTPQQAALEELLSTLGGGEFFLAPPLWIDIEMGEEGEGEEFQEENEEFSSLERPYLFGSPDLRNVKNLPTLLGGGKVENLLRLSYLR
ncbi:beta strand repeat-containing protein, partial [Thermodesulfobacteriota bacterium]